MEEHISPITSFVNHYLGSIALAILQALHIQPKRPDLPIPQHIVMGFLVVLLVTVLVLILRLRLSVEKPGAIQQIAELLITNPIEPLYEMYKQLGLRTVGDKPVEHPHAYNVRVG